MVELGIPGFVDLQVNGFVGVDFSSPDLTEESFGHACRELLSRGTAAFLPTIITSPLEVYARNLPILARGMDLPEFQGRLLGLHLEGPFISSQPGAVGAHNPAWVRPPDLELLQRLYQWSERSIRLVTLAAELPGAETLVRWAAGQAMVVSIGHTLASAEDLRRLTKAGALALTHLGNGLPHLLHKFSNPLMAGLADERYTAMLIGDGHHIPAGVLKVMLRAKGVPQSIIVSDAAPVAGLPPGGYFTLGNEAVLEESGRLYNPAKGVLVGSSATLLKCMNHLASLDFLTLEDLLDLGFYNPLHLLGLDPAQLPSIESRLSFDEERHQFMIS
jgi:N-acetylglucosamine-6-phosphate deacetylase